MSFKNAVVQEGPNRYILPQVSKMRCPVIAFLTPELFAATDEATWNQAAQSASYPGVTHVYLMPDTHVGYGVPIGGVVVTTDSLIQAGAGYDISCGVLYMKARGLTAAEVADPEKRRMWIQEIEIRVATGIGSHQPEKMRRTDWTFVQDVLRNGARVLGVSKDLCERLALPVDEAHFKDTRVEKALKKAPLQMGSLGGGNHFIEMQVDPKDSSVWLMIHCGSRGYGWETANYYNYAGAEVRGIAKNRREESWLSVDEPLGKEYWAHHNSAGNYAIVNRHIIAEAIKDATEAVFGKTADVFYEISHNLIQQETLVLPDGTQTRGYVHRKGATRAFPAGHPDLYNTKWVESGHPCLIPGSMLHGAAILYPLEGAKASACSVNHGSGRLLGRGDAKRNLHALQEDIDLEMQTTRLTCADGTVIEGIIMNTEQTPLEECGHAYKVLDDVLKVLEDEGIAKVAHRMYPVCNIKGLD